MQATSTVLSVADAGAVVIDTRGCALGKLTIVPGGAVTVSWSRVDSAEASVHVGTPTDVTTLTTLTVDWPFIRLSVSGANGARIALV